MEHTLDSSEQTTAQRLERTVAGRQSMTLCYLVYESEEQRERLSGHIAERLNAHKGVSLADARENSVQALVEQLEGPPGSPPIQVKEPAGWPGGAAGLGQMLQLARGRMSSECARPVLVWAKDAELTTLMRAGEDLHSWSSGTFDFAEGRERERSANGQEKGYNGGTRQAVSAGGNTEVSPPPPRPKTGTAEALQPEEKPLRHGGDPTMTPPPPRPGAGAAERGARTPGRDGPGAQQPADR